MDTCYNKLIYKFNDVSYDRDKTQLLNTIKRIRRRYDGVIVLKFRKDNKTFELKNFLPGVDEHRIVHGFTNVKANNDPINIEVVMQLPFIDKYYGGDTKVYESIDLYDSSISEPVFFRPNGSVVDFVNQFYNAGIFLICNGSSLKDLVLAPLNNPGVLKFGINNGAHIIRPNFWTAVDDPSRFMSSIWIDPSITKFVPMSNIEKPINENKNPLNCPNIIGYQRNENFDPELFLSEPTVNWGNHKVNGGGRSVMVAALKIIYALGFRRVYLLGCDFHMVSYQGYFFPEERTIQAVKNNNNSYEIMRGYFERLLPYFNAANFKIFNCNPLSMLETFPYKSFEDAISECTAEIDLSESTYGKYVDKSVKQDKLNLTKENS